MSEKKRERERERERESYLFSGLAFHTEIIIFRNMGSQSLGIFNLVFSFATAMMICTPSNPRQGCFLATISYFTTITLCVFSYKGKYIPIRAHRRRKHPKLLSILSSAYSQVPSTTRLNEGVTYACVMKGCLPVRVRYCSEWYECLPPLT